MCQKEAEDVFVKPGGDRFMYDVTTASSRQLQGSDTLTSRAASSRSSLHSEKTKHSEGSSVFSQPRDLLASHTSTDVKIRAGKEKEIYTQEEHDEHPLICTSISTTTENWVTFPSPVSSERSGSSFDVHEAAKFRCYNQRSLLEDISGHYMPHRELNRSLGRSTVSNSSDILPYYDFPTTPTLWDDDFGNSFHYRSVRSSGQSSTPSQPSFQLQTSEQQGTSVTTPTDVFCILVWDEDSATKKSLENDLLKEEASRSSAQASPDRSSLFLPQKQFGQYLVVPPRPLSDLDAELASRLHRETYGSERPDSPWPSLQEPIIRAATPQLTFECRVCYEREAVTSKISLWECGHNFCKPCLVAYVKSRIEDNRYPIFCPECLSEYSRVTRTRITDAVIAELDLPEASLERLKQLELLAHSVSLECPKCRKTMNVDKVTFAGQSVIVCQIVTCGHIWCNDCMKDVTGPESHRCKSGNIDKLMKRKGWKYCPGCRTPVQKSNGCNHITCGAPGCNVHFCYRCGSLMIDTSDGGDVGAAVTEHYFNCKMFEKKLKCSIQ